MFTTSFAGIIRRAGLLALCALCAVPALASPPEWPPVTRECRPWTYWWWMGSAVTEAELARHARVYREAGLGGMHIIPIYGAEGWQDQYVPYLSDRWMELLHCAVREAEKEDLGMDMTLGTGWPYGGPWVGPEQASPKAFFQPYTVAAGGRLEEPVRCLEQPEARLQALMGYAGDGTVLDLTSKVTPDGALDWSPESGAWMLAAVFQGWTKMQVKRAAPGGEGNVLDHWSRPKLAHYLARFEEAFDKNPGEGPRCFYLDSYEVYGQNWTDTLFDKFKERRGYDLRGKLPALMGLGDADTTSRVRSDYNETVGELLLEEFTEPWAAWIRARGARSRNEAHGSPGNLLDLYAAADIPETEGFGREGSEVLMTKFAASAAHVAGRPLVSSESCTWLDEHFQERPTAVKAEMDKLFLGGVNHAFYHGTAYSPEDAPWPGWLFYASTHVGPTNPWHRHLPEINGYITRCQSFLQAGAPDAEILLYNPVYDLWPQPSKEAPGLHRFTVHNTNEWMHTALKDFHETALALWDRGYDFDFVSDRLLATADLSRYRAVILPRCGLMPPQTLARLAELANSGMAVLSIGPLPGDVPGLGNLEARRAELAERLAALRALPNVVEAETLEAGLGAVPLRREAAVDHGIAFVRRRMEDGHAWFLVNRGDAPFDGWLPLSTGGAAAALFDPMTGASGMIPLRAENGGCAVRLELMPGQSGIVRVYDTPREGTPWNLWESAGDAVPVTGTWKMSFLDGGPTLPPAYESAEPACWTARNTPETDAFSGTALYRVDFEHRPGAESQEWLLDLGGVHGCARVRVNGEAAGSVWCPPYRLPVGKWLKPGKNTLEIEVTNLAANRIAAMDRNKEPWQKFFFVNIDYKAFDASGWPVTPSGLEGLVTLTPLGSKR